jgi:hypothetical protein
MPKNACLCRLYEIHFLNMITPASALSSNSTVISKAAHYALSESRAASGVVGKFEDRALAGRMHNLPEAPIY